jgi:integrase
MPHVNQQIPRYCRHEPTGQAYVRFEGRQFYLGRWSRAASAPSKEKYDRLIAEWMAAGRRMPVPAHPITIAEVAVRFRQHARDYYRRPDGQPTSEVGNFDLAIRPLLKLYSNLPAAEFGPLKLETVRNAMIASGWARRTINQQTGRIKMIFKWAAGRELVSAAVHEALTKLAGLRMGRTDAREPDPIKPVPIAHVDAVLPFLSKPVAAMVRLQLITGMRPGEACIMRTADINTAGKLWIYQPPRHKTQHHGHERTIYLGPKAQDVIRPFLKTELRAFLFSPAEAAREHRQRRTQARKTPRQYGNRPGTNRKRHPKWQPGDHYNVAAYRRAIARACDKAFAPQELLEDARAAELLAMEKAARSAEAAAKSGKATSAKKSAAAPMTPEQIEELGRWRSAIARWQCEHRWHPHQLRHTAATELRRTHGLEAAQVILGHKTLTVTQIYAEKNVEAAMKIMAAIG